MIATEGENEGFLIPLTPYEAMGYHPLAEILFLEETFPSLAGTLAAAASFHGHELAECLDTALYADEEHLAFVRVFFSKEALSHSPEKMRALWGYEDSFNPATEEDHKEYRGLTKISMHSQGIFVARQLRALGKKAPEALAPTRRALALAFGKPSWAGTHFDSAYSLKLLRDFKVPLEEGIQALEDAASAELTILEFREYLRQRKALEASELPLAWSKGLLFEEGHPLPCYRSPSVKYSGEIPSHRELLKRAATLRGEAA